MTQRVQSVAQAMTIVDDIMGYIVALGRMAGDDGVADVRGARRDAAALKTWLNGHGDAERERVFALRVKLGRCPKEHREPVPGCYDCDAIARARAEAGKAQ